MRNRVFMTVTGLVVLMLAGCGGQTKPQVKAPAYTDVLAIVHFNDTHSHLLAMERKKANGEILQIGGIARRKTLIDQLRQETPNVLVLDAGDYNTGSIFSTMYKGMLDVELMNMCGYSVGTVGNHEFDAGLDNFHKQVRATEHPIISANIYDRKTNQPLLHPYIITNIAGAKIVIAGLLTSDTGVLNRDVVKQLEVIKEATAVSNLLYGLKLKETNDIFILLTHIGYDVDRKLAEIFPEVDYIVGGHSHTRLGRPAKVGKVLIMQNGQWGEEFAYLTLFLKDGKVVSNAYKMRMITDATPPDAGVEKILQEKQKEMEKETERVIAVSDTEVINPALGNMIADSMAWKSGADVALMNAGGVRANLPKGEIRVKDVHMTSPFNNQLIKFKMKGSDLKELIIKAATTGSYLYWSGGLQATIANGKLMAAKINGKDVADNTVYTICSSDFIFHGGDGYDMIEKKAVEWYDTGFSARDTLIEYVEKTKELNNKTLDSNPRVNKRY